MAQVADLEGTPEEAPDAPGGIAPREPGPEGELLVGLRVTSRGGDGGRDFPPAQVEGIRCAVFEVELA